MWQDRNLEQHLGQFLDCNKIICIVLKFRKKELERHCLFSQQKLLGHCSFYVVFKGICEVSYYIYTNFVNMFVVLAVEIIHGANFEFGLFVYIITVITKRS